MAKKEKEQKPVLTFDDKEYVIEDMTDEQKALSSGVHNYYTFFNSEMLEAEIQAAINAASE